MSGGWLGLLFQRRIARMLGALEGLFAQWKAGTLPVPAVPVRRTARAGGSQAAGPGMPRPRVPAARREPVARAAAPVMPVAAARRPAVLFCPGPALRAPPPPRLRPPRRRARCTEKRRWEGEDQHARFIPLS
jgi:hypothetical protein